MATDRDEQQRQQQELEEIRRSFAEMGARMGSLFEPAEIEQEAEPAQAALPAPPAAPSTAPERPRWWAAAVLALVFLAGGLVGFILPISQSGDPDSPAAPASVATPSTGARAATPLPTAQPRTKTSVPEECLEAAELADEIISRLNRNIRDNRLATALVEFTAANQACRKEASP
jgi:hypothetical protein